MTREIIPPNPTILTYHKVIPRLELSITSVTPKRFARHLQLLRDEGYTSVSMNAILAALDGGAPLPPKSVHLTFDDGYLDFLDAAFEACRSNGFHVSVFPVVGYIGKLNRWDVTVPHAPHLDWHHLRDLLNEGVHVGAHTMTHPFLNRLPRKEAFQEIADSKKWLEDGLGVEIPTFSYPFGRMTPGTAELVEEVGFRAAFTMTPDADPTARFALPRAGVYLMDGPRRLAAKIGARGVGAWRRECLVNRWISRVAYAKLLVPTAERVVRDSD